MALQKGQRLREAGQFEVAAVGQIKSAGDTGANKGKAYQQVKITRYDFMYGKSLHFTAKAAVFSALDRLKKVTDKSIAILVPWVLPRFHGHLQEGRSRP
ncbi:hypothetical protein [Xanthomonas citri]|uniref:hypothetical protein n=1 Tax=Xanthomonas citri TaxID=346 RepID=UPI000BACB62E|nr:hypothetical protein [Xanthomonas citri]ASY84546.1 hypothetical protein CIW71_11450 [Xanthomonas citri pv. malvacearum]